MNLVKPYSLASTIDTINEALFFKRPISRSERIKAAKWIASRVDMPGSYESMPGPTSKDFKTGIRVFTGERISTRAGIAHILGQEACRVLLLLDVDLPEVTEALRTTTKHIVRRMKFANPKKADGMYCCGPCSCAAWRHIEAGGLRGCRNMLKKGPKALRNRRNNKGRWKGFPFYYTILTLNKMIQPEACIELLYAFDACRKALSSLRGTDKFTVRRRHLLQRVVARCEKLERLKWTR